MLRSSFVVLVIICTLPLIAAEPTDPAAVVSQAKAYLDAKQPARAILVLEAALPTAGGRADFPSLLAAAYDAELRELEASKAPTAVIAALRAKRDLLPKPAPSNDEAESKLAEGVKLFNLASTKPEKYAEAAKLFAAAFRKVEMTPEQTAAWAYCRIRLANEKLAKSTDAAAASEVLDEVEAALATVPNQAKLREAAESVLILAKQRGGVRRLPTTGTAAKRESANFVLDADVDAEAAKAILTEAEQRRAALFARWIGATPPADWSPKCVLSAQRERTVGSGQAVVELQQGRATKRLLPILNAEHGAAADDWNRELTHLMLADLFPFKAPPKWVEIGIAATSMSETEQERYRKVLLTLDAERKLMPLSELLAARETPIDRLVEFHVQAASLVRFLIVWRGEAHFLSVLRDAERYGAAAALARGYGTTDLNHLESLWKRAATAK